MCVTTPKLDALKQACIYWNEVEVDTFLPVMYHSVTSMGIMENSSSTAPPPLGLSCRALLLLSKLRTSGMCKTSATSRLLKGILGCIQVIIPISAYGPAGIRPGLVTVVCSDLFMPGANWVPSLRPSYSCYSILIFGSDVYLNIEIMWIPGATAQWTTTTATPPTTLLPARYWLATFLPLVVGTSLSTDSNSMLSEKQGNI